MSDRKFWTAMWFGPYFTLHSDILFWSSRNCCRSFVITGLLRASVTIGSGILKFCGLLELVRRSRKRVKRAGLGLGLAGVGTRLGKRDTKLVEFDFAGQLTIDADDDVVGGFKVLHGLER